MPQGAGNNPYSSIYLPEAERLGISTNINTASVADAIARAQRGEKVVTQELASELAGQPVTLYRSHRNAALSDTLKDSELEPLGFLISQKIVHSGLSQDRADELNTRIHDFAKNSGLPENLVRYALRIDEELYAEREKNLIQHFLPTSDPETRKLADNVARGLIQIARNGSLNPDELATYTKSRAALAERTAKDLSEESRKFVDYIINEHDSGKEFVKKFGASLKELINSDAYMVLENQERMIIIPEEYPYNIYKYIDAGFREDDLPKGAVPATPELISLYKLLHEAEHVTHTTPGKTEPDAAIVIKGVENAPYKNQYAAAQMDAEFAAHHTLRAKGAMALSEYLLSATNVVSFVYGLGEDSNKSPVNRADRVVSQSFPTYYRTFTQTGDQIDIQKLHDARIDLYVKTLERMDLATGNDKTAEYLGALADALKNDKRLTDVQRAEAESILRDAEKIGYKPNMDYPRKMEPTQAPVLSQPTLTFN